MAGLVGQALLAAAAGGATRRMPLLVNASLIVTPVRGAKVKKPAQKPKKKATIDSIMTSLETKGFLRPYKAYTPGHDVAERLERLCHGLGLSFEPETRVDDLLVRFKLFARCAEEFDHSIPNSQLVSVETIGDVMTFYETEVLSKTPYESLDNKDLPPNLYVMQNYHRFHPDTDTMFGGKTAFPQNATIVTGLKYKDKYKGYRPEKAWPIKVKEILLEY